LKGQEGKLHSGIQKKQTFSSTPVGTGRNGICKEDRGAMKSVLWGTREKKNEFLQKKL